MSLEFTESFDWSNNVGDVFSYGGVAGKWESLGDSFGTSFPTGRFGLGFASHGASGHIHRTRQLTAHATYISGCAYYFTGANDYLGLMAFLDGYTEHVKLGVNASRQLVAFRGDGTLLGTGTTTITFNVWHYIEIKVTVHNSTGTVEVRLNGNVEINLTGQDTQNGGSAQVNRYQAGWQSGASAFGFAKDDLYVCSGGGSVNNDFLGDVRIACLFPGGNGNSSQLDGSDGNSTDNYLLVDEFNPNGDTDYVMSDTPGEKDTYVYGDLPTTAGTVHGVMIQPRARKDDAGARSIVTVARLSGTETDGPVQTLETTYNSKHDIRETKPGGGAWSVTDVNNAEFGVKVNA